MKKFYSTVMLMLLLLVLANAPVIVHAQCPGGGTPLTIVHDTTEQIFSGNSTSNYSIPRFDPSLGTLIAVNISARITGVVSMRLENDVPASATYRVNYSRNDNISGPGLTTSLSNTINRNYGNYNLAASNGAPFSGPDYIAIGPDTVLNNFTIQRNITTNLITFLGTGNLSYRFRVSATANVFGSSNYTFSVSTTSFVRFRVIYTYCPVVLLPATILNFSVIPRGQKLAALRWTTENDHAFNQYNIEVSRDGLHFRPIDTREGRPNINGQPNRYEFLFRGDRTERGRFYFRINRQLGNLPPAYANIQFTDMEDDKPVDYIVYPNPAIEYIDIEFDKNRTNTYHVQLSNITGQVVYAGNYRLSNERKIRISLPAGYRPGMYFLQTSTLQGGELKITKLTVGKEN
jgi:Secretion system C-terminal sorting domain